METIFDTMPEQGWTVKASRDGLAGAYQSALVNHTVYDFGELDMAKNETIFNQIYTFMVRDIERRG